VKGFTRKSTGPCPHGLYRCWNVPATGNEDNRHLGALSRNLLLHFGTIPVRQGKIEDNAALRTFMIADFHRGEKNE
jgi:hypothetical protein